ncbi:hypothetical protein C8R44DRAFT_988294 [Mycena epipterygia]|nr:hypothetical protein C8R44DRAFT_988294 [Mycena epipterygia]
MALTSQPPELLDIMTSFVPLPSDLLSLAFTSKALYAIIIPRHLEFREKHDAQDYAPKLRNDAVISGTREAQDEAPRPHDLDEMHEL